MREAFINVLSNLAQTDSRIRLITADLGFGVLDGFRARCPAQFLNVGVAEQNMMGIATGMAQEGLRPFVYSIANFPVLRCFEQLRNGPCYHHLPVHIIAVGAGLSYGPLGFSHHATEDFSVLRALPLSIYAPCDDSEAIAVATDMSQAEGPSYVRLDRTGVATQAGANQTDHGSLRQPRVWRAGGDALIVAIGSILGEALDAAERLAKQGIQVEVLAIRCLKPWDEDAVLKRLAAHRHIITVEEHVRSGGLGGQLAELAIERQIVPERFIRLGIDALSKIVGSQRYLRGLYGIDAVAITHAVQTALTLRKDVA